MFVRHAACPLLDVGMSSTLARSFPTFRTGVIMNAGKVLFPVLLGLSLAAGAAHAQQAAPQAPADEMKAAVDDKFRQLDANGDGTISQEESTKMKGLAERFQSADKNKDGKLDRGEFGLAMGG